MKGIEGGERIAAERRERREMPTTLASNMTPTKLTTVTDVKVGTRVARIC